MIPLSGLHDASQLRHLPDVATNCFVHVSQNTWPQLRAGTRNDST
jgi:hypothetical protein